MVDKFRIARLERLHKRCLDASDKYTRLCHVSLRSDDSGAWSVLSECEWEQFPTSLLDLPDENHRAEYLEVILAHWLLGAMKNRPLLFESGRKQHSMLQKWHEPQIRGILEEYEMLVFQTFGPQLLEWEESQRMHRVALNRWLTDLAVHELWQIGAEASRSVWNRLHFGEPLNEWYGTFTDPNPFANIDDGIAEFIELASELVPEVNHRSALPNHAGLEERDHVALGKQWIQFLYDNFQPARKCFGFVEGTRLEWNVFSASARAIEEILTSEKTSLSNSEVAEGVGSKASGKLDTVDVSFDKYFFWLWHSGLETPLPFARVNDISPVEAEWLHDFLWQKADNYFLVDMSKEDCLNAHNLNAVEFIDGKRVVGEGEAEVHRTSLRECITENQMDHWLDLCDAWPKGAWEHLPSGWQGEDIYTWVDQLHDWSERAVAELMVARSYRSPLNQSAIVGHSLEAISPPGETNQILVSLQQAADIAYTPKKTLEHWKYEGKLPEEFRKGKGRLPALWDWGVLRPVLENLVGMSLPERPQVSSSGTNKE